MLSIQSPKSDDVSRFFSLLFFFFFFFSFDGRFFSYYILLSTIELMLKYGAYGQQAKDSFVRVFVST